MKNRKWLIIIVSIILITNLAFYITIHLSKTEGIVKEKLSEYLSAKMDAEVQIGSFSFNDQQINITDFSIIDNSNNYSIEIKQIYVDYHLLKLLFSKFKNLHSIENISIYEPSIEYKVKQSKGKKSERELPDLSAYFQKLKIHNGDIFIQFHSKNFSIDQSIENINFKIDNQNKTKIELSATTPDSGKISGFALINREKIISASVNLENILPDSLQIKLLKDPHTLVNLKIDVNDNKLTYKGCLESINSTFLNMPLTADSIDVFGDLSNMHIQSSTIQMNNNLITGGLNLHNVFAKSGTISGSLISDEVDLHSLHPILAGGSKARMNFSGKIRDPRLSGVIDCADFNVKEQEFTNSLVDVEFLKKGIKFRVKRSNWHDQKFYGVGTYYFSNILKCQVFADSFLFARNGINFQGKLSSKIGYDKKIKIDSQISKGEISGKNFILDHLSARATLDKNDYKIEIKKDNKEFLGNLSGNLSTKKSTASIGFHKFKLGKTLKSFSLPRLSGNIYVSSDIDSLMATASLRLFDKAFGKLDGRFSLNYFADKKNDFAQLFIDSYKAKFNYEDLKISLFAEGTMDSLQTKKFEVNDDINIKSWLRIRPKTDFFVEIQGQKVKIKDYLKYFMNYNFTQKISGKTSFILEYDSRKDGNLGGVFEVNGFRYAEMHKLNADLQFFGSREYINIKEFSINEQKQKFLDLKGDIFLQPEIKIKTVGKINNLNLAKIFAQNNLKGIFNGNIAYYHNSNGNIIDLDVRGNDCDFGGIEADSIKLVCSQKDKRFDVADCQIIKHGEYKFFASGKIGYTFWNNNKFQDGNLLNIYFKGDLLKILSKKIPLFETGSSTSELKLSVGIKDNDLLFQVGNFYLREAKLKIRNQVELIDKINMNLYIENDSLKIRNCFLRMGEGRIYFDNKILLDEKDFKLGSLNLGRLYIHTNDKGILLNIHGYIPNDSVVKMLAKGRYEPNLVVTGPFDDINILGDLYFSNGGVIYPPNTENVITLFGKLNKGNANDYEEEREEIDLPIDLDLMFHVGDNLRYVTFPTNLKVKSGGYLHLIYKDGKFSVPEANFLCDEGDIDMFGTQLKTDFVQVKINPFVGGFYLNGTFYRKASDGTLITLTVFKNQDKNSSEPLQFKLDSDNPNDGMLDILAKLRYNRTIDDISNEERKMLLQDELIQIAGLGLETAIIDPFIHPLENQIRKLFRLDFFQVRTTIVQNFFKSYSNKEGEKNFVEKEELDSVTKFGADMFLNNLSIQMGKYITNRLFLSYEVQFQKPEEVAIYSKLGIYHNLSLRYDLPKHLKIALRYKINPFKQKNSEEIALEKSFRFW